MSYYYVYNNDSSYSVLKKVCSLFQNEFSAEWDLVRSLSNFKCPCFLKIQEVLTSSSSSSLIAILPSIFFPLIKCFGMQFLRKM